jgi:uncharacterized cupredoxin-like copper-binding protein
MEVSLHRVRIALALLGVAAAGVAAAFAVPALAATSSSSAVSKTTTVTVIATEFHFKLSRTTVPVGTVVFKVVNKGKIGHDFEINGKVTPMLKPGKSATVKVVFRKKGKYKYLCLVPGHAANGL